MLKRIQRGDADIRPALINEVKARTAGASVPKVLTGLDCKVFTRTKVEPMAGPLPDRRTAGGARHARSLPHLSHPNTIERGAEKGLS